MPLLVKKTMKKKQPKRMKISKKINTPLSDLYKFKRQGGTTFLTWKYDAVAGITVGSSGLINKGLPVSSTLTTIGGLTGYYDFGASQYFMLQDVPTYADFTNLYDRYRITGVKLKITYLDNNAAVNGLSVLPVLNYAVDVDDNAVPTSESVMQQKQDVKTKVLVANKPISIYIKNPKVAAAALNSSGTFDATMVSKGYLNCAIPNTVHNGIKYWISSVYSNANSQCAIRIVPTYYFSMKDPQ